MSTWLLLYLFLEGWLKLLQETHSNHSPNSISIIISCFRFRAHHLHGSNINFHQVGFHHLAPKLVPSFGSCSILWVKFHHWHQLCSSMNSVWPSSIMILVMKLKKVWKKLLKSKVTKYLEKARGHSKRKGWNWNKGQTFHSKKGTYNFETQEWKDTREN